MLKEIKINSKEKNEIIEITTQVEKIISESKIKSGACILYTPHTTAGIMINENADSNVKIDLLNAFEKIVPKITYLHSEGNSDAHLKSALVGKEKTLIIDNNSLVLGTWDGIYFCEFDGPRERKIILKIIKEN